MPRIRTVKYELFEDEALAECSRDARLMFVGLIAWADDHGNQRANPALIRGHVFPYDADLAPVDIERMLAQLAEVGVVQLYNVEGERFLHIRGWHKHQRVDNAGKPQVPGPEQGKVEELPGVAATRRDSRLEGEGEGEGERDRKGRTTTSAAPTRDDHPLAFLLADLVAGNDPDGKWTAPSKTACEAERLLIERDERDPEQIRHVIEFVQSDEFERNVVHSMAKLRRRYPELLGKARAAWKRTHGGAANGSARSSRVSELIERGRAAAAQASA